MNTALVIGAGIVGLHTAFCLKKNKFDVYVLEQEPFLAEHGSGRNTGVLHAGIFYTAGSLKEKLCVEGNLLTRHWLDTLSIRHQLCGKWIVPAKNQADSLDAFYEKLKTLPLPEPVMTSGKELKQKEPALKQTKALFIPSSGILDAASYVKALAATLENSGVPVIMNCKVFTCHDQKLVTSRGEIDFDLAINCAGLWSDDLAKTAGLSDYTIKPCRGDYYLINKPLLNKPVYHLPVQDALGLGYHLTPTLDNQTLIGPNSFFIQNKTDYEHHSHPDLFFESLDHHVKGVNKNNLQPAYTGNRPKLFYKDKPVSDFTFVKHDNWIHCLGIESPGLTAAPAIARHVMGLV